MLFDVLRDRENSVSHVPLEIYDLVFHFLALIHTELRIRHLHQRFLVEPGGRSLRISGGEHRRSVHCTTVRVHAQILEHFFVFLCIFHDLALIFFVQWQVTKLRVCLLTLLLASLDHDGQILALWVLVFVERRGQRALDCLEVDQDREQ